VLVSGHIQGTGLLICVPALKSPLVPILLNKIPLVIAKELIFQYNPSSLPHLTLEETVVNLKRTRVVTVTKALISEIRRKNLFINENFIITCDKSIFQIERLIKNNNISGKLVTFFNQTKSFDQIKLTVEANLVQNTPNAGGSSENSEALSFEILKKYFNAHLLKTEMEVEYFPMGGSITDYVVILFGSVIAVSVTRAMKHNNEVFSRQNAKTLLEKKLKGINQSSRNSMVKWNKQILHVWVNDKRTIHTLNKVWFYLESSLKTNSVLLITLAEHSNEVFFNKSKKVKKNTNVLLNG